MGGYARAESLLERYLENPNLCKGCNKPILPREGQRLANVTRLTFCSSACAAAHNNRLKPKRKKREKTCHLCGKGFFEGYSQRKYCESCLVTYRNSFAEREKGDVTKRMIYAHATAVMRSREKICQRCGYTHFVDICHIKAIRDFSKTTKVREINDPTNLIYLCPNCHHEFDAGMLPALQISSGGGT